MKALLLGDLCHCEKNRMYFENQDLEALFSDSLDMFKGNDMNIIYGMKH